MPVVRTTYRPAVDTYDEISKTAGATLSYPVRDSSDVIVQASSGTMLVLDSAGNTLVTKSVTGSPTLTATATLDPADLTALEYGYDYRTRWTLVLGSDTETYENMLGLVRTPFPFSALRVGDLTDANTGLSVLIEGSGKTLDSWIDRGHQKSVRWLRVQDNRPAAIISPADVKDLELAWTLELVFFDLATGRDSEHPYRLDAERYREERRAAQATLVFAAVDDDGGISDPERTGEPPIFLSRTGGNRYWIAR